MAIQQIQGKKIFKYDTKKLSKNPNFVQPPIQEKKKKEIVNGNSVENTGKGIYQGDENIYGEQLMNQMEKMMGKLDNIKVTNRNLNVYGEKEKKAVEVEIKRNLYLAKADNVKMDVDEVIEGKVKTKKDKLRALRKRRK
tara:strand:- start:245 stop:661 length:417 start_codon:yes stop_codon:yes gene_type:complete